MFYMNVENEGKGSHDAVKTGFLGGQWTRGILLVSYIFVSLNCLISCKQR